MTMTPTSIVLDGRLKPDGTLEFPEKLDLPPGKVRVTIEAIPEPQASGRSLAAFFDELEQAQAASGFVGRSKEEIDAEVNEMRDEWEDRMREIERIQDEARQARGNPAC